MRRVSFNGATFFFMSRGEKLKDSDIWGNAHVLDERYVLWPRGDFWDVRFMGTDRKPGEWVEIADQPFSDESRAWLAACKHWEQLCKERTKRWGR